MATEVKMPKLGLTMVDGEVIEWRKKEEDAVEKQDILLVIETEKVTYDVESPTSGILAGIAVQVGETVPIGTVLAYITEPGETLAEMPESLKEEGNLTLPSETSALVSAAIAAQPKGREEPAPIQKGKMKISPLARKLAKKYGLDIFKLAGTGPQGRIEKKDVLRAVEEVKRKPVLPEPVVEEILPSKGELLPLAGMRRTIAHRMSESFKTPHFWIEISINANKLKEIREQLIPLIEKETGQRPTYTDLIVKAVSRALEAFPAVNSKWTEDGIVVCTEINVGIATSIDEGLIVPVINQANTKSLAEITKRRTDIVTRGREGKLGPDEMTGSTITITNLGMAGIERGYAILNPPEAAILSLSAIKERPVVVAGKVVPVLSLNMTLGIDHRVLDGFIGAEFLNKVKDLIENPLLLL